MPTGDNYRITPPGGTTEADFEAIYQLLDQYNADLARFRVKLAPRAAQSRKQLFEGADPAGLKPSMDWVADVYSWAGTLAVHFARQSLRLWNAVFAFLAVAGVALTSIHTLRGGGSVLAAYYLCLLLAFVTARWERKKKRRNRHEDYRALAEALRVQFFWMVAGLPDLAADEYLRKQAAVMAWIRDAMSECGLFEDTIQHIWGAPRVWN
jgi:Flp pilus assembly protein TadB